jgi:ribulose-5-phosphate 4-epimerase/fuculose-1-phosphate aldolase
MLFEHACICGVGLQMGDNSFRASKENKLKRHIIEISGRCGSQGWCPGTLGNISTLDSDLRVYIKRTGADLSRLKLEDILTLDIDGNVLEGKGKPSIETNFHLGIYKLRHDVKAVFHVHPPFATAYAVAGKKIPMVTEAAKIVLVDVPLLPRAPPGSIKLATAVKNCFKVLRVNAALLKEHGTVSVGKSLENAYHTTALVEDTAKIAFLSGLIKDPEG